MNKEFSLNELQDREKELEDALNGLRQYMNFVKKFNSADHQSESTSVAPKVQLQEAKVINKPIRKIPVQYRNDLTIPDKMLFAFYKLNKDFTKVDVGNQIIELEPSYNGGLKKAILDAGMWCYRLRKKGIIKAIKQGSGNDPSVYKMNE